MTLSKISNVTCTQKKFSTSRETAVTEMFCIVDWIIMTVDDITYLISAAGRWDALSANILQC